MNKTLKKIILSPFNILYKISPKTALKSLFHIKQGHRLDLQNPKTFNEKINWLKLYYRNDLMPICADKFKVRQYVRDCGYGDILNDLLWEGFEAEKIPFGKLPNKFVIKVTHGSGNNIICEDKQKLDINKSIKKLKSWLNEKYLPSYGEWFYGVNKPRIIVEKFLSDENSKIPEDYKMFCFNNVNGDQSVGFTAIDIDRFRNHKRKIYDRQWNHMDNVSLVWPNDKSVSYSKPAQYEKMVSIAKALSKPFPHARIDFYVVNDQIYFGEITFTDNAGFGKITPRDFHKRMGSWIRLPHENETDLVAASIEE